MLAWSNEIKDNYSLHVQVITEKYFSVSQMVLFGKT
jgi:hypothetical protein